MPQQPTWHIALEVCQLAANAHMALVDLQQQQQDKQQQQQQDRQHCQQ
jgi:hypothetical protein